MREGNPVTRLALRQLRTVLRVVASHYHVTQLQLRGPGRHARYSLPRMVGMALMKEVTNLDYRTITRTFGRYDHGTAMHAYKRLPKLCERYPGVAADVEHIRRRLEKELPVQPMRMW